MAGTASGGTPTWSVVSGPVVIGDPSKLNTGVTFTGGGSARLRLTVASNATPACADAIDDVDLNVTVGTVLISAPTPGCNGILTYTAAVDGQTGCTFSWSVDGRSLKTFLPGPADDVRVARVSGTNFGTFQLVTISLDDPDQNDAALKILREKHVAGTNYLSTLPSRDRFADQAFQRKARSGALLQPGWARFGMVRAGCGLPDSSQPVMEEEPCPVLVSPGPISVR